MKFYILGQVTLNFRLQVSVENLKNSVVKFSKCLKITYSNFKMSRKFINRCNYSIKSKFIAKLSAPRKKAMKYKFISSPGERISFVQRARLEIEIFISRN